MIGNDRPTPRGVVNGNEPTLPTHSAAVRFEMKRAGKWEMKKFLPWQNQSMPRGAGGGLEARGPRRGPRFEIFMRREERKEIAGFLTNGLAVHNSVVTQT